MIDIATLSLWHDSMPAGEWDLERPPLPGDVDVDVAIVGGGFTGLWTAHALAELDPHLRVVVLEAEVVGFGASGRNGGWCSALLPMELGTVAAGHGRAEAVRMQRAMYSTIDEVGAVVAREGIDCHFIKSGYVHLARSPAQAKRIRDEIATTHSFGFDDADLRWLGSTEANDIAGATRVLGGAFTPHCAAVHPARLVRGLARVVEGRGVTIHERTRATDIRPGEVRTDAGTVRAPIVVRATEAFTPRLPGHRRSVAPIYSLMIATEPLPADVLDQIGLRHREVFNDARTMIIYGQRTADDRIAFGGRGAPYHYASAVRPEFDRHDRVHAELRRTLVDLFPSIGDARITHRWGGAVAAPRDWWCSVGIDRANGLAWAGGYVGDGVATTNLAGRTLADLILQRDTELTTLPWVQHRSPKWEPEPLRWLGINAMVRLSEGADRAEARTGRSSGWRTGLIERLTGSGGSPPAAARRTATRRRTR